VNQVRGAVGSIAILAATVGGVAAVAFALGAWIAPSASLAEPTPTPQPSFDLAVAPEAVGGSLVISGDRSGTLTLDTAMGIGGRFELEEDGSVRIRDANAPIELRGASGHIRFDSDSGEVAHIAYDGLSIFLDPDQCTITHGAVNEGADLMAALVECPDIADIRGQGVISVAGVVALPADALRGRGNLPPTGGRLEVDGRTYIFDEAEIFLDTEPLEETGRIHEGIVAIDRALFIGIEYEPETDRFFVGNVEYAPLAEPCPTEAEELGRLNDYTTVIRLDIECTDVAIEGGGTGSVTGSIVADVIQGYTEKVTEP